MISIQPYDERWPDEFQEIHRQLNGSLGDLAVSVDHIGSTAVPGLAAKDIIDVQVTVAELSPAVKEALNNLGYQHVARITHDHIPSEWPDQNPDLWRKWFFREPEGSRRVNCHVRQAGQPNQRYPLLFRDYLRAFPLAASAYSDLKIATVKYHPEDDMDAYYDIKDPVMDIISASAEYWARTSNWSPHTAKQ